mgnify:CR=1 FL=1
MRCNFVDMAFDPAPRDRLDLDLIRARLGGDADAYDRAVAALHERPGRAAGRVAAWSLGRAADMIARYARRPIRLGAESAPATVQERQILMILDAIAGGDDALARDGARFLVQPNAVELLIERLTPASRAVAGLKASAA